MKKRRSTVYVRPGKDVTLYIPSDTPPEVIEYLNRLKRDGMFSHGIMEIVSGYVLSKQTAAAAAEFFMEEELSPSDESFGPYVPDERDDAAYAAEQEEPADSRQAAKPVLSEEPKSFSLTQIFRQAKQNSGKLYHTSEKASNVQSELP
ncbi:hypothetical protein [Paenibacillus sp. MBLB4367]|uniref:hypothetical protein n=1 Tax=Paenibacillus sp. MBLB4367 TaxID=3384767 RepID=UPI0039082CAA